jgi:hypothetical protein
MEIPVICISPVAAVSLPAFRPPASSPHAPELRISLGQMETV